MPFFIKYIKECEYTIAGTSEENEVIERRNTYEYTQEYEK